jgi:hypothetical protein
VLRIDAAKHYVNAESQNSSKRTHPAQLHSVPAHEFRIYSAQIKINTGAGADVWNDEPAFNQDFQKGEGPTNFIP